MLCLESGVWSSEAADSWKALMAPQSSAKVFRLVFPEGIFSLHAPAGIWEVAMGHMKDGGNGRRQKPEGVRAGDTIPAKTKIALNALASSSLPPLPHPFYFSFTSPTISSNELAGLQISLPINPFASRAKVCFSWQPVLEVSVRCLLTEQHMVIHAGVAPRPG